MELNFDQLLRIAKGGITVTNKINDLWRGLELLLTETISIPKKKPMKFLIYLSQNADDERVVRKGFEFLMKTYNKEEQQLLGDRQLIKKMAKAELTKLFLNHIY